MKIKELNAEIICPDCGQNVADTVAVQIENEIIKHKKRSAKRNLIISAVALFLVAVTVLLIIIVPKIKYRKQDKMIEECIQNVSDAWSEDFKQYENSTFVIDENPTIIIKNTRIIKIKDNNIPEFKDVDFVVQFLILSNYHTFAPYYEHTGLYENVIFYKDGTSKVSQSNPFGSASVLTSDPTLQAVVDDVTDLNERYNRTIELK